MVFPQLQLIINPHLRYRNQDSHSAGSWASNPALVEYPNASFSWWLGVSYQRFAVRFPLLKGFIKLLY